MHGCKLIVIIVLNLFYDGETARILSVLQVPSKSHNLVFRPILEELRKRGHEMVVVSVDPMYETGKIPENVTEIDIHDVSYTYVRKRFITSWSQKKDALGTLRDFYALTADIFLKQMQLPEIQQLVNDKKRKFDLLFLDSTSRISLVLSHVLKTPVIIVGTTGLFDRHNNVLGVPKHLFLYPQCSRHRLYDLTIWEKIKILFTEYLVYRVQRDTEDYENQIIKRIFGPETPTISELEKNVGMLFSGDQAIWEDNRPVPPSVIYIGGINRLPEQPLSQDIKTYLDNSPQGVIYVSFGNNINTSDIPIETAQLLKNVFVNLKFNVCLKWESDFPWKSHNIRTFKWLPQADFLRHPKVKLFITHGGLRSTEDAIEAGVPLIGIPMFLDQFFNTEKYIRHGIGIQLDRDTLTEEQLNAAINTIIGNKSYQENVIKLRTIINDQPQSSLERAVWWTEHVLRHGGARHLRAPAANMGWAEYYDLELVLTVLFSIFVIFTLTVFCIYVCIKVMVKNKKPKSKVF